MLPLPHHLRIICIESEHIDRITRGDRHRIARNIGVIGFFAWGLEKQVDAINNRSQHNHDRQNKEPFAPRRRVAVVNRSGSPGGSLWLGGMCVSHGVVLAGTEVVSRTLAAGLNPPNTEVHTSELQSLMRISYAV